MKFAFAPEATPLAGYTIKRAIDRGGFGEVYYALSDSGKEVALKLLQRNHQVELRGVSQCLNLKHTNLVTIFDIRTDADDDHWVVMEYVAGKSLEYVIADHPNGLPLDEVEGWLAGIAAGTAFLHDRGIVHRDLKPANVFRENGVVKIGDVGLSKFITPSRRSAQTDSVGTVYYMAPEVARGKYGSELDVYSLGVILYEMLTGYVPFSGESTAEILMKHLTEPPDLSKIPVEFRGVLARALEKDPLRRTPGVSRLLDEFRAARQGKPVAEEIPASHFVDFPVLERSAMLNAAATGAKPRQALNDFPATVHYPNGSRPNPFTPPRPPQPPEPFARACGKATRNACNRFENEVRRHPWLPALLVVGVLSMFPGLAAVGRGFAPGLAWGEIMLLAGVSFVTYRIVKKAVGGQQLAAGNGPQVARGGLPRPGHRPVVAQQPRPVVEPQPVIQRPVQRPVERPVERPVVHHPSVPRPTPQAHPTAFSPNTVRDIPFRQRMSELTGAMTMAVVWGAAATAAVAGLAGNIPPLHIERDLLSSAGGLGLFGFTTVLGAWAVLIASKLLEGTGVGSRQRRMIQTVLGAAIGAGAWWLHDMLLVDLTFHSTFPGILQHLGKFDLLTKSPVWQPSLIGYVVFFAALF
ncbi:MAG TPA: protein kinase, partial [Planctomycetaceae bacterium]